MLVQRMDIVEKVKALCLNPVSAKNVILLVDEITGDEGSKLDLGQDDEVIYGSCYLQLGFYDPQDAGLTFPYEKGVEAVHKTRSALQRSFDDLLNAVLHRIH